MSSASADAARGPQPARGPTAAGDVEVHVVSFASGAAFAAYRDDPRRAGPRAHLEASGAELELLEMEDVATA